MNFGIQYPSNWGKPEYENFEPEIILSVVYFDNFQVAMEEVGEPYLDTGTMTVKNISLEQRVQKELNNHASSANEKIIRHNWVTVAEKPAYKIEYTTSHENSIPGDYDYGDPDSYSFEIFTMANGKLYRLSYGDEQLKVPETLPLANKMVESFQIK